MPFTARVFKVLIASPSDVFEERDIIENVIQSWNNRNSISEKIILFPARWETQVPATLNVSPQSEVNRRIVDDCDLAVGVFWTRIGTPTDFFESGTIEELDKVGKAKKTIMLYYSRRPVNLDSIDFSQAEKVKQFREKNLSKGIILDYKDLNGFEKQFANDLDIHIREIIAKDKKENTVILEKPGKVYHTESTSEFPKLLAIMWKQVPTLKDPNNQPTERVMTKIKSMLNHMEKNSKWKEELINGLELNIFQQALNQTVPNLDKKKYMYDKLSDLLPRIFNNTNFRLYKSDINNNSPKIGLLNLTVLNDYYPIENTEIPPTHSVQGYKNALSYFRINLPLGDEFNKFIDFVENVEIDAQNKTSIIQALINSGFDDKKAINIFNSLKALELLTEKGNDDEGTKLYQLLISDKEQIKHKIKEKIEVALEEVCNPKIFDALFGKNE